MKLKINFDFYSKLFEKAYLFLLHNLLLIPAFLLCWLGLAAPFPLIFKFILVEFAILALLMSALTSWQSLIEELDNYDNKPLKHWFLTGHHVLKKLLKPLLIFQLLLTVLFIDFLMILRLPVLLKFELPILIFIAFLASHILLKYAYFSLFTAKMQLLTPVNQLKLAFFTTIKKWYLTLVNTLLLGAMISLAYFMPQFGLFIAPSIFGYLIYKNCQSLSKLGERWCQAIGVAEDNQK
jgi:hypothetical protein